MAEWSFQERHRGIEEALRRRSQELQNVAFSLDIRSSAPGIGANVHTWFADHLAREINEATRAHGNRLNPWSAKAESGVLTVYHRWLDPIVEGDQPLAPEQVYQIILRECQSLFAVDIRGAPRYEYPERDLNYAPVPSEVKRAIRSMGLRLHSKFWTLFSFVKAEENETMQRLAYHSAQVEYDAETVRQQSENLSRLVRWLAGKIDLPSSLLGEYRRQMRDTIERIEQGDASHAYRQVFLPLVRMQEGMELNGAQAEVHVSKECAEVRVRDKEHPHMMVQITVLPGQEREGRYLLQGLLFAYRTSPEPGLWIVKQGGSIKGTDAILSRARGKGEYE